MLVICNHANLSTAQQHPQCVSKVESGSESTCAVPSHLLHSTHPPSLWDPCPHQNRHHVVQQHLSTRMT